jgi:hypothetical protein
MLIKGRYSICSKGDIVMRSSLLSALHAVPWGRDFCFSMHLQPASKGLIVNLLKAACSLRSFGQLGS